MNIGILATVNSSVGGGYQYIVTMLNSLKAVDTGGNRFYIFYTEPDFPFSHFEGDNWRSIRISGAKPPMDIARKALKLLFPG
jgi:hypothetical protein